MATDRLKMLLENNNVFITNTLQKHYLKKDVTKPQSVLLCESHTLP